MSGVRTPAAVGEELRDSASVNTCPTPGVCCAHGENDSSNILHAMSPALMAYAGIGCRIFVTSVSQVSFKLLDIDPS